MLVFLMLLCSVGITFVDGQGSLYSPVLVHNEKNFTKHEILGLLGSGFDPTTAACDNWVTNYKYGMQCHFKKIKDYEKAALITEAKATLGIISFNSKLYLFFFQTKS